MVVVVVVVCVCWGVGGWWGGELSHTLSCTRRASARVRTIPPPLTPKQSTPKQSTNPRRIRTVGDCVVPRADVVLDKQLDELGERRVNVRGDLELHRVRACNLARTSSERPRLCLAAGRRVRAAAHKARAPACLKGRGTVQFQAISACQGRTDLVALALPVPASGARGRGRRTRTLPAPPLRAAMETRREEQTRGDTRPTLASRGERLGVRGQGPRQLLRHTAYAAACTAQA